jgi:hypothetical protein
MTAMANTDLFGLTPAQKKRARRQRARGKRAAAKTRELLPHPVPLAGDASTYSGPRHDAEKIRRASGYTSLRLSKATLALLRRVEKQAMDRANARVEQRRKAARDGGSWWGFGGSYHQLGLDELLYWDALQRLGELPEKFDQVRD